MATAIEPQQREEELLSPQQMLQVASMSIEAGTRETDPRILRVAAQLSWLASQHHASEYNQLKFGGKGAPATYIPLTIMLPSHVRELRVYQQKNAQRQTWYYSSRSLHATNTQNPAPVIHAGVHPNEDKINDLQEALSLAISSPLPPPPMHLRPVAKDPIGAAAKTSETHPINMSPMVPFELLDRLSTFLQDPKKGSQPTYLHLPYELTLDALTTPEYLPTPPLHPPPAGVPVLPSEPLETKALPPLPSGLLQAEITKDIPTPPPAPHRSPKLSDTAVDPTLIPLPLSPNDKRSSLIPVSGISTVNGTPGPPQSAQEASYFSQRHSSTVHLENKVISASIKPSLSSIHIQRPSAPEPPLPMDTFRKTASVSYSRPQGDTSTMPYTPPPSSRMGNLLLSSCPGKKVRLQGPVKGRGTIFRNLGRDMQRIRDAGVGCIVCCLDDTELHFLGVSWEEYAREAHELGLDILRIPTPEGFAPLDPSVLNEYLDVLVNRYTLRGISILVHCRGGVGRAGLIACCWMLKLGLVGWIRRIKDQLPSQETLDIFYADHSEPSSDVVNGRMGPQSTMSGGSQEPFSPHPAGSGHSNDSLDGSSLQSSPNQTVKYRLALERIETVDLVERAIRVVRRRRSVKAIETFEQVHFLVQYVEFLRRMGPDRPSDENPNAL